MIPWSPSVAHWASSSLLAIAPWGWLWRPGWVPLLVAAAILAWPPWRRRHPAGPAAPALVVASSLAALVVAGGWVVALVWGGLGVLVVLVARLSSPGTQGRPDAADAVALVGWSGAIAVHAFLLQPDGGGWLAPAILLVAAASVGGAAPRVDDATHPGPPIAEVRGDLSLDGVVLAGDEGGPCSGPLRVQLRPGESMAVLCDSLAEAWPLALTLSGRRKPFAGEVTIDGRAAEPGLVAVVAAGERFVPGDLETNLECLCGDPLDDGARVAVHEACALGDVVAALSEAELDEDGSPLSPLHRLLVLAARVIPSHYRVVVVMDPTPWTNAVRGALWRSAVVRASVGRTAVWMTQDRELASRADVMVELRHGALFPVR